MRRRAFILLFLATVLLSSGCGNSSLAPVRGRVTCNGKPVPDAAVIFSPLPQSENDKESGKAGQGGTDADGRYVIGTYKQGDGALIGKHRVAVTLDNAVKSPCKSKVVVFEVKPGDNDFDIELNK